VKRKKLTVACIAVVVLCVLGYVYFGYGNRVSPLARIARGMIMRGDWEDGIRLLEFNARLFPGSVNAHTSLGRAYFYHSDRDKARHEIQKALEMDPDLLVNIILWKKLMLVPEGFKVPEILATNSFRIRPLMASDVELDYAAVMSSVKHLKGVLGDKWPSDDMTKKEDLRALKMHEEQFARREMFTYTVMNNNETECLGCIYIGYSKLDDYDAQVVMWVTQDSYDAGLDSILFETVDKWLRTEWPFEKVIYPGRTLSWEEFYRRLTEQDKKYH